MITFKLLFVLFVPAVFFILRFAACLYRCVYLEIVSWFEIRL